MPAEKKSGTFKHIELIAYILAFWSFFVLFLEPIFEYYTSSYSTIEFITALANLVLLVLTILSRVLSREVKENKTVVYFDLVMLILGSLLLTYQAKFVIFFLLIRQTWFIVQFILWTDLRVEGIFCRKGFAERNICPQINWRDSTGNNKRPENKVTK